MYAPLSGQRLGFVGLGNMGRAMARHLHTAGAEVVVWNRSAAPAEAAVALGMRRATSLPDLARAVGPGVICLNLTTTQVVEEVVFGPDGLIGGLDPGALVIDFGTTGVPETRQFAAGPSPGPVAASREATSNGGTTGSALEVGSRTPRGWGRRVVATQRTNRRDRGSRRGLSEATSNGAQGFPLEVGSQTPRGLASPLNHGPIGGTGWSRRGLGEAAYNGGARTRWLAAARRTPSGVHHLAAVDVDRLAGEIAGVVRGEKDRHGGKLGRRLPAAKG
jgi:hypothetical protein